MEEPVALVVAHPDDETIGAGAALPLFRRLLLVHATDGAPRDVADARAAGFATAADYAAARRRELDAALAAGGVRAERAALGAADQGASFRMAELSRALAALLERHGARAVLTHPYEGGHPDHDAVAFCARAAASLLARRGARRAGDRGDGLLPRRAGGLGRRRASCPAARRPPCVALTGEERARKRAMLDAFATQAATLARFPVGEEVFRAAPRLRLRRAAARGRAALRALPLGHGRRALAPPRGGGGARAGLGGVNGRPLTVLSVAYPLAPVGPDAVGGAEQVLSAVDRALVAAGHRSIVVAQEGSRVAGALRPVPRPAGALDDAARARGAGAHGARGGGGAAGGAGGRRAPARDRLPRLPAAAGAAGAGHACTCRRPGIRPRRSGPSRPGTWLHGVSASQHAALLEARAEPLLPPVRNGVPVEALGAARHARRSFALALGRICPEKGQHLALGAARAAGRAAADRRRRLSLRRRTSGTSRRRSRRCSTAGAASSAPSASRASAGCWPPRAACSCRARRPRPARSWRWRRPPAARRWSPSPPARCRRRWSTAAPASSCPTRPRMAEAIGRVGALDPGSHPARRARAVLGGAHGGRVPGAVPAPRRMRTEVLTTDAALDGLRPEWEALWRRAGGRTPRRSSRPLGCCPGGAPSAPAGRARRPCAATATGGCSACCRSTCWRRGARPSCCRSASACRTTWTSCSTRTRRRTRRHGCCEAALAASPEATSCDLTDLPPGAALRDAPAPPGLARRGTRARGALPGAGACRPARPWRRCCPAGAAPPCATRATAPSARGAARSAPRPPTRWTSASARWSRCTGRGGKRGAGRAACWPTRASSPCSGTRRRSCWRRACCACRCCAWTACPPRRIARCWAAAAASCSTSAASTPRAPARAPARSCWATLIEWALAEGLARAAFPARATRTTSTPGARRTASTRAPPPAAGRERAGLSAGERRGGGGSAPPLPRGPHLARGRAGPPRARGPFAGGDRGALVRPARRRRPRGGARAPGPRATRRAGRAARHAGRVPPGPWSGAGKRRKPRWRASPRPSTAPWPSPRRRASPRTP